MCRELGDLSADVPDPGADWANKGLTWQAFESMRYVTLIHSAASGFASCDSSLLRSAATYHFKFLTSCFRQAGAARWIIVPRNCRRVRATASSRYIWNQLP
jgi:hypothetical protein